MPGARGRGLALILVVGVLGILAVLAAAFVTMAQLERRASQQRLQATQALLLARSGIEEALARIRGGQDPEAAPNRYEGENWDASPNGLLDAGEAAEQVYRVTAPGTRADTDACPAAHAMRPAFFKRDLVGQPALAPVSGRRRGLTGELGAGRSYALKLRRGGIHVNGGDPGAASDLGYNAVLKRILGTLAEAVDREDGADDGVPVDQADGEALIDQRPPSGWRSLAEIGGVLGKAKAEALFPYLALDAWTDKRVIAPNAPATLANASVSSWGQIRLAHDTYPDAAPGTRRAPDFERIPVAPGGKLVGRAPVDLAWARRHRPVLVALVAGLKGLALDESTLSGWHAGNRMGTLRDVEIANTWTLADDTHLAVDGIMAWTSGLSTWPQWSAFCDTLPLSGTTDIQQAKRDILKANFNPNGNLNKFNPNPSLWKEVDKSDLLVYSTEFSLAPVQAWEAECVGRILDASGRVLGMRTVRARVSGPGVVRFSTQADFACGDLGALDLPGDEGLPRLPGDPGFISLSQGSEPTWGHRLPGLGGMGAGLQSYPEPCVNTGSGLSINPAAYDGNLQLATLELEDDATYGVPGGPPGSSGDTRLLLRFDDGFDPDLWTSTLPGGDKCQASGALLSQAELGNSLLDPTWPNTLHPDGAYAEGGRAPAFQDRDNAHPYHGVLSYWVKHNYSTTRKSINVNRYRIDLSRLNSSSDATTNPAPDSSAQVFFIGNGRKPAEANPQFIFETSRGTDGAMFDTDVNESHIADWDGPPLAIPPHTWMLITAFWDFRSVSPTGGYTGQDSGRFVINDSLAWPSAAYGTDANRMNQHLLAEDITRNDQSGANNSLVPHLMVLGPHPRRDKYRSGWGGALSSGDGADATFDEFAICDFGGAEPTLTTGVFLPASQNTLESALNLGNARYKVGRYYKGAMYRAPDGPATNDEAGSWVSAPVRLPTGSLLHGIHWTFLRPAVLPGDYAEVELLDPVASAYLWGNFPPEVVAKSLSSKGPGWTPDRQDWALGRIPPSPFRLRVSFLRPPITVPGTYPDLSNTPVLDSPALDDLTLLYTPPQGPRVLAWEEGA